MNFSKVLLSICCLIMISSNLKSAQESSAGLRKLYLKTSSIKNPDGSDKAFQASGSNIADIKKDLAEQVAKLGYSPADYDVVIYHAGVGVLPDAVMISEFDKQNAPKEFNLIKKASTAGLRTLYLKTSSIKNPDGSDKAFHASGSNIADIKKDLAEQVAKLGYSPANYDIVIYHAGVGVLPDAVMLSEFDEQNPPKSFNLIKK